MLARQRLGTLPQEALGLDLSNGQAGGLHVLRLLQTPPALQYLLCLDFISFHKMFLSFTNYNIVTVIK